MSECKDCACHARKVEMLRKVVLELIWATARDQRSCPECGHYLSGAHSLECSIAEEFELWRKKR